MTDPEPDINTDADGHTPPAQQSFSARIAVELASDRARAGEPPFRTASVEFTVPEAIRAALASGPAAHLAGFAAFLLTVARYSDSESVVIEAAGGPDQVELAGESTLAELVQRLGCGPGGAEPSALSTGQPGLVFMAGGATQRPAPPEAAELVLWLWPGQPVVA